MQTRPVPLAQYIREHHGTVTRFARHIGVTQPAVSRWMKAGWLVWRGRLYAPRNSIPDHPITPEPVDKRSQEYRDWLPEEIQ